MAVSCDPSFLLQSAQCIESCLTPAQQEAIETYLVCQWQASGGGNGSVSDIMTEGGADLMTEGGDSMQTE